MIPPLARQALQHGRLAWRRTWHALGEGLPASCEVCLSWPSRPVCDACLARFATPVARCRHCAIGLPHGRSVCGRCLQSPMLERALCAVEYGYPWQGLITRFKLGGQTGLARGLAGLLARLPDAREAIAQAHWLLPMPLSPQRLAERGYNQAWELVRVLAGSIASATPRPDPMLLLRVRDAPSQMALDRRAREANMRHAFAVDPARRHEVSGRRVVLVDDVLTTGATLRAACAALQQAGVASVVALAVARTPAPDLSQPLHPSSR